MKRLMHVAYEVQEKLERDDLFLGVGRGISKLVGELLDLVDDTIVGWSRGSWLSWRYSRMTEASLVEIRV